MILAKTVEAYRREVFLHQATEAVERLRSDPKAWADYLEEPHHWDEGADSDVPPEERE